MKISSFSVLFLSALLLANTADAEELNYNLYSLQAEVSRDVANDLMIVSLVTTHQAATASEAANQVNADMEWALDIAEAESEIITRTEQYNTYPQYRSEKIVGWTVSQSLRLETDDFETLTDLIGELQERLNVQSMQFAVKRETRAEVENQLIEEVLEAYRRRADIVAKSMGADSYDMVDTNINTQNGYVTVSARHRTDSFNSLQEAPVSVEAGESNISVTVNGQIQLVF